MANLKITVIKKFNNEEGSFFKFEEVVLPNNIPGEGADEIIFVIPPETILRVDDCRFNTNLTLKGKNITQNFKLSNNEWKAY